MKDNEIIKALECCSNLEACEKCPLASLQKYDADTCEHQIMLYALDLINRQKAEIERLKKGIIYTVKFNEKQLEQIKDDILQNVEFNINNIKSEAVREYAERFKERLRDNAKFDRGEHTYYLVGDSFVDNIADEMLGETEVKDNAE